MNTAAEQHSNVSTTTLERRLARAQRRARDAGSAWVISFMAGDLDAMDVEAEDAEHWRGEAAALGAQLQARGAK